MTAANYTDIERVYTDIMIELKARVTAIAVAGAGHMRIASPFVREFCYLQIRMISELIALGCLAAHGDIPDLKNKTVQRQWSAHKIMAKLEALHPEFFPHAVRVETKEGKRIRYTTIRNGVMTKAELLALYFECDQHLHRGGLKKLIDERRPAKLKFADIESHIRRINSLMVSHMTITRGDRAALVCDLQADQGRGVEVFMASAQ